MQVEYPEELDRSMECGDDSNNASSCSTVPHGRNYPITGASGQVEFSRDLVGPLLDVLLLLAHMYRLVKRTSFVTRLFFHTARCISYGAGGVEGKKILAMKKELIIPWSELLTHARRWRNRIMPSRFVGSRRQNFAPTLWHAFVQSRAIQLKRSICRECRVCLFGRAQGLSLPRYAQFR